MEAEQDLAAFKLDQRDLLVPCGLQRFRRLFGGYWPSQLTDQEDCCDICGDIGVSEALRTCFQCKINRFHMYCLKSRLELEHAGLDGSPEHKWYCDVCESKPKTTPLASSRGGGFTRMPRLINSSNGAMPVEGRKLQNESRKGSFNWEKKVDRGKAKYIPVKEALKLPSRAEGPSSPIKSKTIFLPRQDLASGPLRKNKVQTPGNKEVSESLQQSKRPADVEPSRTTHTPSQAITCERIVKKQASGTQLLQKTGVNSVNKNNSAPSSDFSPITISGGNGEYTANPGTCNAENLNDPALNPALDALWKGSFSVQVDYGKWELNHQMQAHPPCRLHRGILEFFKQMPEVLQFQSVPLEDFWMEFLQQCAPDARNIGLYFFPSVKWSSSGYVALLEDITASNFALRTQIADVELLVFTSKLLPPHQQCCRNKFFLWGIFRNLKQANTAPNMLLQSPDHESPAENRREDHEMDMEIDMIGGVDVGRMDNFQSLRIHVRENVEEESPESYPPGFEEAYKLLKLKKAQMK